MLGYQAVSDFALRQWFLNIQTASLNLTCTCSFVYRLQMIEKEKENKNSSQVVALFSLYKFL